MQVELAAVSGAMRWGLHLTRAGRVSAVWKEDGIALPLWLKANYYQLDMACYWWSCGESNPGPLQCDCSALPSELQPRSGGGDYTAPLGPVNQFLGHDLEASSPGPIAWLGGER